MAESHRGCLAIADISGYTRFLTGVELDHSHDILAELIACIVESMQDCFTLAKLEGDAVFCFDTRAEPDGQVILATIEATYFAFRKRLREIEHLSMCRCNACGSVSSLDLKFVVHHGTFLTHHVAGQRELVGPEVIALHRLLKNSIKEQTDVEAYAFLTDDLLGASGIGIESAPRHAESTDAGEVSGLVLDLAKRWEASERSVAIFVKPEDAFVDVSCELTDAPLAVVWELVSSPVKRVDWLESLVRNDENLAGGERRAGAKNHCVHSTPAGEFDIYHEIVDWKPFRYFTEHTHGPAGETFDTYVFTELPGNAVRVAFRVANAPGVNGPEALAPVIRSSFLGSVNRLQHLVRFHASSAASA